MQKPWQNSRIGSLPLSTYQPYEALLNLVNLVLEANLPPIYKPAFIIVCVQWPISKSQKSLHHRKPSQTCETIFSSTSILALRGSRNHLSKSEPAVCKSALVILRFQRISWFRNPNSSPIIDSRKPPKAVLRQQLNASQFSKLANSTKRNVLPRQTKNSR